MPTSVVIPIIGVGFFCGAYMTDARSGFILAAIILLTVAFINGARFDAKMVSLMEDLQDRITDIEEDRDGTQED